jgi:hypothetical protein
VLVRSETFERPVSSLRQATLREFTLLTSTAIMLARCLHFVVFILQPSLNPEKENSDSGNAAVDMTLIAQPALCGPSYRPALIRLPDCVM